MTTPFELTPNPGDTMVSDLNDVAGETVTIIACIPGEARPWLVEWPDLTRTRHATADLETWTPVARSYTYLFAIGPDAVDGDPPRLLARGEGVVPIPDVDGATHHFAVTVHSWGGQSRLEIGLIGE